MKHSVLIVDDEPDILDALERLLRRKYDVRRAGGGEEGLQVLKDHDIKVIISDHRMPSMTGVEFLQKSIDINPSCIRILLTGYTDIESVIEAINAGEVYRYLTKPWDAVDLLNTIEKAIEKIELRDQLKVKNLELEKALKELKTLDQAKSNFMLLMNHELKTPLTVMTNYSELLQESHLDETQQKAVTRIQQSVDRLTNLVDDSLLLIQADTNTLEIHRSNVDLAAAVESQLESQHFIISDKQLKTLIPFKKIKVKTDNTLLAMILKRLIDNAIKYALPHSEILFTYDEESACLSITNTGQPFPEEKTDELLKPFTIDENVLNHSAGTGMGLAIAGALCRALSIQLDISAEGEQTTVSLLFQDS